jgi:hypothetical protein
MPYNLPAAVPYFFVVHKVHGIEGANHDKTAKPFLSA